MTDLKTRLQPYFPEISDAAWPLLEHWAELMREWNAKVNLVSRKDIEQLEWKHLAHCLVITNQLRLMNGCRVLDLGTGGGLPGLPMAICYPQAHFVLCDSVGKKIKVVEDIVEKLKLKNVKTHYGRVENFKSQFDFVTGRAVTALPVFLDWSMKKLRVGKKNSLENGVIYWKGGEIEPALAKTGLRARNCFEIEEQLKDPAFEGKYILHYRLQDLNHQKNKIAQIAKTYAK